MSTDKYKGLTPHNDAQKGDFAKTVLMPGDPLRAKFIAENFLEDAKEVNHVRGMLAYTGTYKGHKVSVMGSGMGIPSMGIYSYELFEYYDVDNIIRIGSTAGIPMDIKLFDIIVAEESCSNSVFYENFFGRKVDKLPGSKELIEATRKAADKIGLDNVSFGKVLSSDSFYRSPEVLPKVRKENVEKGYLGVEMESFGLYTMAEATNKRALTILTVSDHSITGEVTTSEERQNGFKQMMELALEVAIDMENA